MNNPPVLPRPASVDNGLRALRRVVLLLLCLSLGACKIVILVPPGGKVVSANGDVCLAGQTCVIDVSDTDFDDTFTAVPNEGRGFAGWEKGSGYFCGGNEEPCHLATTSFDGNDNLLAVLASDLEFFLIPRFTPTPGYNWAYWKRVLHQIDNGEFATASALYSIAPIPGQCDPGAIAGPVRKRVLEAVNRTRALHALPPVQYDKNFDMQMQLTGLVQRANEYLSHFPQPGDACYSADAEIGAASANLSGGSRISDPAEDVFGWTNDNHNVAALMEAGHRRWILFPELGYTAYGQVDGYAALKVFDFNRAPAQEPDPGLGFVAMPYRNYPYVLVSGGDKPTPWSLSIVPPQGVSGGFDYFSSANISVVDKGSGLPLNVHSVHSDSKGFGLRNFLSWMVDGWDYDTRYTVSINNIQQPGGAPLQIQYEVMLDRFNLFTVDKPLEAGDSAEAAGFSGTFDSEQDEDSYRLALSGNVSFSKSPGYFLRIYDAGKQLVVSADGDFSRNFAAADYTVVASRCDENGLCYQGVNSYSASFQ